MGAAFFMNTNTTHPNDLDKAFQDEREQALYDYGHRGYSGTIAEKSHAIEVGRAKTFEEAHELADDWEEWRYEREGKNPLPAAISDKWGPANAIRVPGEGWLFFGWASS